MPNIDLSDEKRSEIESFLISRFSYLNDLRRKIDDEIKEEVEIYNNKDRAIDNKEEWEEKYKVPYVFTIVQTMRARILEALFGKPNYIKAFVEEEKWSEEEKTLTEWLQELLDKLRFSSRCADAVESSLVKRTSWLQLRPIQRDLQYGDVTKQGLKIEFDVLEWEQVWFDTNAKDVNETDFFVRKIKKYFDIKSNRKNYFNLNRVRPTINMTELDNLFTKDEYKVKHSGGEREPTYDDNPPRAKPTDIVELLEYYGVYDMAEGDMDDEDYEPDLKEMIFTIANRTTLVRAEENTLQTKRKHLMFPLRPIRQANSLIGKGVPQLTKNLAKELNEARSLRMQNFKQLVKLLFKYRRTGGIDLEELYAGDGNAIGFEDSPDDIQVMQTPNVVGIASAMGSEITQDMQQVTGAVDFVMGTNAGRGFAETAAGTRTITEQALFKFNMMAENIHNDLLDFINFVIILYFKYAPFEVLGRYPGMQAFIDTKLEDIEDGYLCDISLKDVSQRRDVERKQWADAIAIIAPMVQQSGGNMQYLIKEFLEVFEMQNIEKILQPEDPQAIAAKLLNNPQLNQAVQTIIAQVVQQAGGGVPASVSSAAAVDEQVNQQVRPQ